jgi:hypothetical protein
MALAFQAGKAKPSMPMRFALVRGPLTVLVIFAILIAGDGREARAAALAPVGPMNALQFFDGAWHCTTGTATSRQRYESTGIFRWDADGLIQSAAWDLVAPSTGQRQYIRYNVTYDKSHHRYTAADLEAGQQASTTTSDGWTGNTMRWVGDPDDGTHFQYDFIRRGPSAFELAYSDMRNGKRTYDQTSYCRRLPRGR